MNRNDYLDMRIFDMIEQAKKQDISSEDPSKVTKDTQTKEQSIYTGIRIGRKWYDFEERPFVEDRIIMIVPSEFVEMDTESS